MGRIGEGPLKGYHELATIKHRIDLHDTLCMEDSDRLSLECDDPQVPCDQRNLCIRAAELVQRECGIDKAVRMTLRKRIPVMGGLAGGSANAATVLQMLNEFWDLGLSVHRLMELGRNLGMDVPFYFSSGNTAFDTETRGVCVPLKTGIGFTFVLALPGFGVSTSEAYGDLDYAEVGKRRSCTERMRNYCLANDPQGVVSLIHNDFEHSVFRRYPRLSVIRRELLEAGCSAAALSGSGSTLFGIVTGPRQAEEVCGKVSCRTLVVSSR